jgi:hypothetical protein
MSMAHKDLKVSDIIIFNNYKYLVCDVKKTMIKLLPIDLILQSDDYNPLLIPKFEILNINLESYIKTDNEELFYLLNQKNDVIKKILEKYFE